MYALFSRGVTHALQSSDPSLSLWLGKFGKDIVRKCKGLHLAAKALGGLFRSKPNVQYWNNILKNEIWDLVESEMVPALRVSYDYLPPHLKRCIVYCSLFPKDFEFEKKDLILMWMGEGFLQPTNRGMMTLEEVGYDYFDDLTTRSFFQPSIERSSHFVMHDLFHDLTIMVGRDFFFRLEKEGDGNKISNRARHMSYINLNFPTSDDICSLRGAKALRTIVGFDSKWLPSSVGMTIMSLDLKYLRVLSFRRFQAFKVLPDSVGEFIHLRYLDLSETGIVTLPNSLCRLYNLQTLRLYCCVKLKMLPNDMQDLVNLHCLEIWGTPLKEMPRGMSKLKKLQILSKFIVGKEEGSTIQELGEIENFTGYLEIYKLENIKNCDEVSEAKMMRKKQIKSLSFYWSHDDCINSSQTENDIIDQLQPHEDLKSLTIVNYRGTMFPNWLGHVSYNNMTRLRLQDCKNCWKLPPFGQLAALTHLEISGLEKVVSIGAEFYKGDDYTSPVIPFASLEDLAIKNMAALEKWHSTEIEAFPKLQHVSIDGCPKLIGDLPSQLLSLKSLEIDECPLLASSIPRCPEIQSLNISRSQKVVFQDQVLLSLKSLEIKGCPLLASSIPTCPEIERLHISTSQNVVFQDQELPHSLSSLSISGDGMLNSVFKAMAHSRIRNLKEFRLINCSNAMSVPVICLPLSVKELSICNCKHIEFPRQQSQVSLERLSIRDSCDMLTFLSIQIFPHLKSLSVIRFKNLISVLDSNTSPLQNLQYMCIHGCKNLKRLSDDSTECILPNLKSLSISECPKVEAFPMGFLPSSLTELEIRSCEKVLAHHREWHLPSLTSLSIYDQNGNIKCFPEGYSLPATLTTLNLCNLSNLEQLNCEGLQHLTSLHQLKIYNCPNVEKLTGQMLPTSLTKLIIGDCNLLEERCSNKDEEIWPKISHIPAIRLTHEWISFDTTFHTHTHRSN